MRATWRVSIRRACSVLRAERSSYHYKAKRRPQAVLSKRIKEIAEYCETDIVNTYRVWLRYELFRGRVSSGECEASHHCLAEYLKEKRESKPHLAGMAG